MAITFRAFELILPLLLAWVGVTQILLPFYFQQPWFPLVRDGRVARFVRRILSAKV